MASSRGTKLGARQLAAIEALLRPGTIEDAARQAGVTTKTLLRWMKNPESEFMAVYRAAVRADCRQTMASLGQEPTQIIRAILRVMYQSKKPTLRLKAAREITLLANEANQIEEFAAGVADAQRLIIAAQLRCQSTGVGMKARTGGHGAKLPRRAEQAIVALLAQRSVADAARTVGIRPHTLRLWMQGPAFEAKHAESACEVYGPSMRLAQQHLGDAVVVIRNLSVDPTVPEETRLKAAIYRARVQSKCDCPSGVAPVRDGARRRRQG
jgi:transposase-like protein